LSRRLLCATGTASELLERGLGAVLTKAADPG